MDVIGAEILNMITALRSFSSSLTELEFGRTDPSDSGNCLVGNHWITLHLGTVPQAAEVFFGIVSNQGFENLEELSLYFEKRALATVENHRTRGNLAVGRLFPQSHPREFF